MTEWASVRVVRAPLKVTGMHSSRCHLRPASSHLKPSSIKHNELHHSHPLARPRFTANPAQSHRPPAQLASALCFATPAQAASTITTNTFTTPRRPLSQHRKQQYQGSKASHRPRWTLRGRCQDRQGNHRRAQSVAALLRHDLHLQEVSGALVASHHKASLPLWHRLGELPWMQE